MQFIVSQIDPIFKLKIMVFVENWPLDTDGICLRLYSDTIKSKMLAAKKHTVKKTPKNVEKLIVSKRFCT